MSVTRLNYALDDTGHCTYAVLNPQQKYKVELQNGTPVNFTVPSESPRWVISYSYENGAKTFVAINGVTSAPTTNIEPCEDELHPSQRVVKAGDVITFETFLTSDIVGFCLLATK